ncbi:hypothetical protein BSFA1_63820 (plasmid) [Burkholderia sp. SFA1]|uniref:peptidoglycan-binding domain-containing protein n=1 Tax=unclassified Caballeronia TaxID=2646786 RepID=UPI001F3BAE70|nr:MULTISPECIES: peptidoglycan-binding domain-containing protein [unclassified Caballeronia]MCE4545900.1 peptidoglycan-binding protein [Caballeronia sp. PC1]MCE4571978.1 peptidoglycan-binding protein [Caballeronia sp. CLC5]BBQ01254.1 hypothetical protein BSFA1_63820 [Burkholderia sp. SFA1]
MDPANYPAAAKAELVFKDQLSIGANGPAVRRVQEWLNLHGPGVSIDGKFGTATAHALSTFQNANRIAATGKLDLDTWNALVAPMTAALRTATAAAFPAHVEAVARQHLVAGAREAGGDNCGPWVRLYTGGRDGAQWKWCAGFVTLVLQQTVNELGITMPLPGSLSCDTLAAQAQRSGRFVSGDDIATGKVPWVELGASYVFLVQRTENDWSHTGFGFGGTPDHFNTLEGNTNDDGNANGYEVAERVRAAKGKDFIRLQ